MFFVFTDYVDSIDLKIDNGWLINMLIIAQVFVNASVLFVISLIDIVRGIKNIKIKFLGI